MRFNIVTNLTNQAGLEREYLFLRASLEAFGHEVNGVQFNDVKSEVPAADINIFIEVMAEHAFKAAPQHWFIPHSEWYFAEMWDRFLPQFSKVICKTHDALRIWTKKIGPAKCVFTGWESLDFYRPEIKKLPKFLHVPGRSMTRQTEVVAQAWKTRRLPFPLTVVSAFTPSQMKCENIPNLKFVSRVTDEELAVLMNESLFIIAPSKYEGFGHLAHEAIGCGAVLITTNAPPMNEFRGVDPQMLVPVARRDPWRAAVSNVIVPSSLAQTVHQAAALPAERWFAISKGARAAFLADRADFRQRFAELMKGIQ